MTLSNYAILHLLMKVKMQLVKSSYCNLLKFKFNAFRLTQVLFKNDSKSIYNNTNSILILNILIVNYLRQQHSDLILLSYYYLILLCEDLQHEGHTLCGQLFVEIGVLMFNVQCFFYAYFKITIGRINHFETITRVVVFTGCA